MSSKSLKALESKEWIGYVDDERDIGNSIIVTLKENYYFSDDPGCGVKGFDTVRECLNECRKRDVYFNK